MSLPPYAVEFRGRPACPCQATWLPAFEAEALRRGIIDGPLPLSQLIGGAPQSGGTHSAGGADDTWPLTTIRDVEAYVWLSRQMGADATWLRPYNWDHADGVAHVHRVLTGCPHNGPARYQIAAVQDGFNGLGSGGRGAPDDGPRPLSGRTWRQGIKWAKAQAREAEDMQLTDKLNPKQDDSPTVGDVLRKLNNFMGRQDQRSKDILAAIDALPEAATRRDVRRAVEKALADEAATQG